MTAVQTQPQALHSQLLATWFRRPPNHGAADEPLWVIVKNTFAVGKTRAHELCREFLGSASPSEVERRLQVSLARLADPVVQPIACPPWRRCPTWLATRTARNAVPACGFPLTNPTGQWFDCQICGGSGWMRS